MLYSKELNESALKFYSLLSRFPFPKSYLGKILLVAFLGAHVPLLMLIFYFVLSSPLRLESKLHISVITLIATLLGTAFTLYALYSLLAPISLVSRTLYEYIADKKMPDLPTHFTDQAGRLMADVQYTVKQMDELIDSLEKISMTDYLTGVYNRHAGERRLIEDIARVQRSNDTMSLVILDVDDLKLINDQYGHGTGDICLKHVVNTIKSNIRKSDWLARWGGDEFVLVLFSAKDESLGTILERICVSLKGNLVHSQQGVQITLTLSIGVCQYNSNDDIQTLLLKTDNALYQSKRGGKNQIIYYYEQEHPVQI